MKKIMGKIKIWAILIISILIITFISIGLITEIINNVDIRPQVLQIILYVSIIGWAFYGFICIMKKLKQKKIDIIEYNKELNINFSTKIFFKDYLKLSFELKRVNIYFIFNVLFFLIITFFLSERQNIDLLYSILFISVISIFYMYIIFLRAKNIFNTNKSLNEFLTYQINNDLLLIKGETFQDSSLWERFVKIQETKNFFLCYANKIFVIFIFKKEFSEEELIEFRKFLKSLPIKN